MAVGEKNLPQQWLAVLLAPALGEADEELLVARESLPHRCQKKPIPSLLLMANTISWPFRSLRIGRAREDSAAVAALPAALVELVAVSSVGGFRLTPRY